MYLISLWLIKDSTQLDTEKYWRSIKKMFYRIKEKNNKFCCPKSIIYFRPVNISYKDSGFVGYYTKYIHYNAFLRNSIMCSESYKEKYEAVPIVYSYLVFMLFYSP